ncbi:MAG: Calx-beta domain-containing protein, partial [Planctomycetota bacterium]
MCRRSVFSLLAVSLLALANSAGAGVVIMQCDVGDCGPLQSGWTSLGDCGTFANVAGTGIGVTLATGNPGACACRDRGGGGPLADVEIDFLFADNENYSPGSDFIITFSNLIPGAKYRLLSYHSRTDESDTTIPSITITGATVVSVPASIVQNHAIMDNPAECIFIAGAGDASIRFEGPAGGCLGCQAFLNGFVLELDAPTITFEAGASGGVETISPALIPVNLIDPEPGETYTVQYAATGGTATPGDDYSLTPGTLIFNPGQSSKNISIDIVDDAVPEDDETIILTLSGPTGPNVLLTGDQHTYTISDSPPKVSFQTATSSGSEGATPALVAVKLSHASDQTVTVDYAATGGTATNGVDYILAADTLQFDPLNITGYISIDIVDDSDEEDDETIRLSLSDPCNATLGSITQHTRTILDDEEGIVWNGLIWYYSHNPDNLFVNTNGNLQWSPEKGGQYVTRIPPEPLSSAGDKVEVSYWYMSDGKDDCPPDSCYNCIYCDDDITCIAGTSDFRFGLFQADGEYITADGFNVYDPVFADYKGYNWRFGPHLQPYPVRWEQCETREVHKTGNFAKKPQWSSNLMTINEGLEDYIPGFELPPGEWSLLTISLERLSSSDVQMSITLNDTTYTWTDGSSSEQPTLIDVFGVHMRNGRPYSILELAGTSPPPPPPPPAPATNPNPADGATDVDHDVVLTWSPGGDMLLHDVYLGTDFDDANAANMFAGEFKGRQYPDANMYDPCSLEAGWTYYWRIDEVNNGDMWKGDVWSFTTVNYVVVDDVESYETTDDLHSTWVDACLQLSPTGAVLHLGDYTSDPVHGGGKAIKYEYWTDFSQTWWSERNYAEAYLRLAGDKRDWTQVNVKALTLYFFGDPNNDANDTEQMYVGLSDGNDTYAEVRYGDYREGEDMNDIKIAEWQEWNIE